MLIINILAVFGTIGIMQVLKVFGKFIFISLPKLTVDGGNFFDRMLDLGKVDSLGKYIKTKITLKKKIYNIKNITDDDISEHDVYALNELREFIRYLISTGSLSIGNRCKYKLKGGKLDLCILEQGTHLSGAVCMRFESFSADKPILVIIYNLITGDFDTSYTFHNKISVRFKEPQVSLINDIRGFINLMGFQIKNSRFQLA